MRTSGRFGTCLLLGGLLLAAAAPGARAQPIELSPTSPAADNDYRVATYYFNDGKWAQAAEEYGKFLAAYPGHPRAGDARFGLAQALFHLGKYKESADAFKTLIDRNPAFDKQAEAHFQLAQAYLGTRQLEQAVAAFAEMSSRFKTHHLVEWADAKRADCLMDLGRFDQAEAILVPLVDKYVRDKDGAARLAARKKELESSGPQMSTAFEALIQRAEWNLCRAQLEQKRFDQAAKGFEGFLSRNPTGELAESARFRRGQALYHLGQYDQAAAAYEEVARGKGDLAAWASFDRALAIYKGGDRQRAAGAFIESARDFPESERAGRARLYAGVCLFEAGDHDGAIRQFDALIQSKDPVATDEAKYWKGVSQLNLNRPADAAATLAEAIKAHPASPKLADLRLAYGEALMALEQFDRAAGEYEQVATSFPALESAPRVLFNAALARHRARQYIESAKLCAKFLADYPDDKLTPRVLFLAAENQFKMTNYPQAAPLYRQLLDRFAGSSEDADQARVRLAWACFFQKQYDQAVGPLEGLTAKAADALTREATYLKANCLVELKRDEEAAKALEAYVALPGEKPYVDDALLKLAAVRIRQNRHDQALPALERLARDYPESPLRAQVEFELGEVALAQKRYDRALAHYEEVVRRDPKGPMTAAAAFGRGLCFYEQARWKEAADIFAAIARDYPQQDKMLPEVLYRQGLSLQKLGQWTLAEAALTELLRRFGTDPYAGSALMAVGYGQQAQGQFDKAAATFARVIKDHPQAKDLDQAHFELAWSYQQAKNTEQMVQAYQQLAARFPASPLAAYSHYYLAEQHYQKREYAQAAELYGKALSADKDGHVKDLALYWLGWCHGRQGKPAEAAEQFERLVKESPASKLAPNALLCLGEAYLRANRPGDAAERLTRLVEGPAGKDFQYLGEAVVRLGEAQLALGQADKALATFRSARERLAGDPLLPAVDAGVGRALFELKKYDDAVRAFDQALESARHVGEVAAKAQFFIGECHVAQSQLSSADAQDHLSTALKSYIRVTVLYPTFAEWAAPSYYQIGQIQLARGDRADAVKQLQLLVDKFPQSRWAELARRQLAQLRQP